MERAKLITAQRWNVNAISQGGNIETKAWMTRFLAARSKATLAMLLEATDVFDHWNLQTRALAIRVFDDPSIDTSRIGVPLVNLDETGGATSNAAVVSTYTNGQFLADVDLSGTLFKHRPDYSEAVFRGNTTFAHAVFEDSANFEGASFPGRVWVKNIPKDVRERIELAEHS